MIFFKYFSRSTKCLCKIYCWKFLNNFRNLFWKPTTAKLRPIFTNIGWGPRGVTWVLAAWWACTPGREDFLSQQNKYTCCIYRPGKSYQNSIFFINHQFWAEKLPKSPYLLPKIARAEIATFSALIFEICTTTPKYVFFSFFFWHINNLVMVIIWRFEKYFSVFFLF